MFICKKKKEFANLFHYTTITMNKQGTTCFIKKILSEIILPLDIDLWRDSDRGRLYDRVGILIDYFLYQNSLGLPWGSQVTH